MRTLIAPNTKLRRGTEHYLNGKPVWIYRDKGDGTVCICDDKSLYVEFNFWVVLKSDLQTAPKFGNSTLSNKPKPLNADDKQWKVSLDKFFDVQITMIPADCEECGQPFDNYSRDELRSLIAHILPKSRKSGFPGIATHPLNRMFLGTKCGCHNHWDNGNSDDRVKMNIYFNAFKRFSEFAKLLNDRDLLRAYKYLGIK